MSNFEQSSKLTSSNIKHDFGHQRLLSYLNLGLVTPSSGDRALLHHDYERIRLILWQT